MYNVLTGKNHISLFRRQPIYLHTAVILAAMLPGAHSVSAQEGVLAIEEVVVTARRREENLQEVPVSVTTFSSAEIAALGITDVT